MSNKERKLSKFISLLLRHKPEVAGIKLDKYGFALVDELIEGINKTGRFIDMQLLEKIVAEDNKQRYSFNPCKTKIRANQGHSLKVDVELTEKKPPKLLFHGTAERFMKSILEKGILKQNRQYVHLSSDMDTAKAVGERHGKLAMIVVDAEQMYKDGYKFYISANNVWLTDTVPVKYIK